MRSSPCASTPSSSRHGAHPRTRGGGCSRRALGVCRHLCDGCRDAQPSGRVPAWWHSSAAGQITPKWRERLSGMPMTSTGAERLDRRFWARARHPCRGEPQRHPCSTIFCELGRRYRSLDARARGWRGGVEANRRGRGCVAPERL
eukprot:2630335-Pleurochrysis_carterae.AAC.1